MGARGGGSRGKCDNLDLTFDLVRHCGSLGWGLRAKGTGVRTRRTGGLGVWAYLCEVGV